MGMAYTTFCQNSSVALYKVNQYDYVLFFLSFACLLICWLTTTAAVVMCTGCERLKPFKIRKQKLRKLQRGHGLDGPYKHTVSCALLHYVLHASGSFTPHLCLCLAVYSPMLCLPYNLLPRVHQLDGETLFPVGEKRWSVPLTFLEAVDESSV